MIAHSLSARTPRVLAVLLSTALVIRLLILPAVADVGLWVPDEQHYHALATGLVEHGAFATDSGPTSLRPPLYSAAIATLWQVTGTRSLQAVRLLQILLSIGIALLTYVVAKELYDETPALWASGIVAFYPSLMMSNYLILTETLFTFLLLLHVTLLVVLLIRPRAWMAAAAGLALGLAALTRSVVWPLPLLIVPLIAWRAPGTRGRRLAYAGLFAVGYLAVVTPWAVRNTRLQGVPVVIDTMGGMNLMMGNYEHTPHDRMWHAVAMRGEQNWAHALPPTPPGGGEWTEGLKERWAREQAVAFMVAHPALAAWRAAIKFGDFWALERDFVAGVQHGMIRPPLWVTVIVGGVTTVVYPLVLGLALLALWFCPPADWRRHVAPLLIIVVVCGLHTIVFGHPRYRLPLMPLVAVYAGAAVAARAWLRLRDGGWRPAAAAATGVAFLALWTVQFAVRDWPFVQRLFTRMS